MSVHVGPRLKFSKNSDIAASASEFQLDID